MEHYPDNAEVWSMSLEEYTNAYLETFVDPYMDHDAFMDLLEYWLCDVVGEMTHTEFDENYGEE